MTSPEDVRRWLTGDLRLRLAAQRRAATTTNRFHAVVVTANGQVRLEAHNWVDVDTELTMAALAGEVLCPCLPFWAGLVRPDLPGLPVGLWNAMKSRYATMVLLAQQWERHDSTVHPKDRAVLLDTLTSPADWAGYDGQALPREVEAFLRERVTWEQARPWMEAGRKPSRITALAALEGAVPTGRSMRRERVRLTAGWPVNPSQ